MSAAYIGGLSAIKATVGDLIEATTNYTYCKGVVVIYLVTITSEELAADTNMGDEKY